MLSNDTIVAVSSPAGGGGLRGIVRLSGPQAWTLASSIIDAPFATLAPAIYPTLKTRTHHLPAALILFRAPHSFTGEDIAELHLPNSPALLRNIITALTAATGARSADPGEFSARAFFHGKIDLTQAEGIAATIDAANQTQLRAAASLRAGDLFKWTATAAEKLANVLALVEAAIDFTEEEDISFIAPEDLRSRLAAILADLHSLQTSALRWERLDQPPTIVFIGPPNVGKSSLINALTSSDRAIVSPIAGTTRDALAAVMNSQLGPIRLIDVAGVESATDEMRQKMTAARAQALQEADLIVAVTAQDVTSPLHEVVPDTPLIHVENKIDLAPSAANSDVPPNTFRVSARTGENLDQLRSALVQHFAARDSAAAHHLTLNHRHREVLAATAAALDAAIENVSPESLQRHPELLAADLRRALDLLGQITGTISPDEVLGRIFAHFCIGK